MPHTHAETVSYRLSSPTTGAAVGTSSTYGRSCISRSAAPENLPELLPVGLQSQSKVLISNTNKSCHRHRFGHHLWSGPAASGPVVVAHPVHQRPPVRLDGNDPAEAHLGGVSAPDVLSDQLSLLNSLSHHGTCTSGPRCPRRGRPCRFRYPAYPDPP